MSPRTNRETTEETVSLASGGDRVRHSQEPKAATED